MRNFADSSSRTKNQTYAAHGKHMVAGQVEVPVLTPVAELAAAGQYDLKETSKN
jgi:hypothetical protein